MTGIVAIKPEGGKESRAVAASADMENTFWPDPAKDPRVQPILDNFANFAGEGSVAHDDDIDAYSQAVNWLRQRYWSSDHLDKAYEEITKGKDTNPVATGSPCPCCGQPVEITPNGWTCSHCTSFVNGSKRRMVKAGF